MGYDIVDLSKSIPNPFDDTEAFISAFLITYPIREVGVIAQYVPSILREIAKDSKDWVTFNHNLEKRIDRTKNEIQRSSLLYIKQNVKSLFNIRTCEIPKEYFEKNIVFDFSSLNEASKTFYGEILLRKVWKEVKEKKGILICIDEAYRFSRYQENYNSVISEISRQIRAFGKLFIITQNYSDIAKDVANQFATQFIFNTTNEGDLKAFKEIDEKLSWSVATLEKYNFTDAKYYYIHDVVPEIGLYYSPKEYKRNYVVTKEFRPTMAEIKEYILNFIEKNECATTTQIAKNVSKNFRMG
ncbi:MAG: hypothetical protein ACP5O8_04325, partial [Candidatus Aenigmatarchaeota archaeon]